MKIRRFLSVFLLSVLLTALFLVPQAAALDSPVLDAKCALLMDETAGRMLYGHNEKEKAYPASITKVMTALLTLEAVDRGDLSISQPITASHLAVTSIDEDSSTAGIEAGEVLTVEQLLNCLLIVSANEAANVLAEHDILVKVDMGTGDASAKAWGCDLTYDYVKINGDYRT